MQLTPEERAPLLTAERCRRSLRAFLRQAWPIVEPARPFIDAWYIGAICEHLEAVARGEIQKLAIGVPPGHGKSTIVSVAWPAWRWTWRPEWRGIFASYDEGLVLRDSIKCRSIVESAWYQESYCIPDGWQLSDDQNTKHKYDTTRTGFRMATTVGGAGTGHRGDTVAVDDPTKVQDARKRSVLEEAIFWWDVVMSTRVNDPRTGEHLIIMQRLAENDLIGHVLRAEMGYEYLRLPSEYDPKRATITYHYVTVPANGTPEHRARVELWRDPRTEAGELLFPDLYTADVLGKPAMPETPETPATPATGKRKDLGSEVFGAQFNMDPVPDGGGRFPRAWWRFHKPDGRAAPQSGARPRGCYEGAARALPDTFDRMIIALDANFKNKAGADPISLGVWGAKGPDRFLLYRTSGPLGFNRTVAAMEAAVKLYPLARKRIIEDAANGPAIIETLQLKISGVVPVPTHGGKESRAEAVSPQIESGNVFLPDGAPWLEDYVAQFAAFPKGLHDDDVDMTSHALLELSEPESTAAKWLRSARPS